MRYTVMVNIATDGNAERELCNGAYVDDLRAIAELSVKFMGLRFAVVYDDQRNPIAAAGYGSRWEDAANVPKIRK